MKPSMRYLLPKLTVAVLYACLSAPAAAAIVTYNFTQNEHTHFTTGNYVVGTMTVNFDTNTMTAVNLRLVSSTGATLESFTIPVSFTAYTNTICGVERQSYEASFNSGNYNLNLGFVPNSTSTPLPGDESGKHTSYWYGGVAYKLSSQCVQFNAAAPVNPFPTSTSLTQSAATMNNTVALEAALVLDAHPNLQNLFAQFTTDEARSNAISQTLPLFTGSSMISTYSVLTDMSRVIQSRINTNLGSSAKTEIGASNSANYTGTKDLWVRPFVSYMSQDDTNHISDFSTNTYGFVMGADTTINPTLSLGGAIAYADTTIKSNSSITHQKADTGLFQVVLYGNYSLDDKTDATFHIGVGRNSTDAMRDLAFTAATPKAKYDSLTTHLGASIGRVYKLDNTLSVLPSVKLDYIWIKDDAYTETGAGILSLRVNSHSMHALVAATETKLFYQWNDTTTLTCSAGVGFDVLNQQTEVTAAYTGAPTATFKTKGVKPNPWLVQGGLGIVHRYKNNIEISARYDGEYRGSYTNHTGSVKLVWHF